MITNNQTSVEVEGKEIIVKRVFNASRDLIWKAWTQPEHLKNWWGPKGFSITTSEFEMKPGGIWRFIMKGPDGVEYPNKITFKEIVKPERLVYTSADDIEGDPGQFQTIVTFVEEDNKTLLIQRLIFPSAEIREQVVQEFGAIEGVSQTLDRLEAQLVAMR
ncbi:SRPBCC family protein [Neobacillus kokaensis]|uniref:Activator of HSP90 ATPase n=1 Tax=Neobacillus kokaensis TaxID=2759023 RepID=A0ABQ3N4D0_9BACI|nr:SRPBCC family protein [Neobacillus kokaensis]GHH99779.1 activator of HSP90 ATPase [Neobacillus kokaensis]